MIGGFAVIAHGVVRTTKDLDICPSPERSNLERLAAYLLRVDARQLGADDFGPGELPFDPRSPDDLAQGGNFRLQTPHGILDVMQWVAGLDAEPAFAALDRAAVTADLDGLPVKVCSLAHLRAMKQAAGRPQDLQDLSDLAAAHPSA